MIRLHPAIAGPIVVGLALAAAVPGSGSSQAATPRIVGDIVTAYDPQDFDLYLRDRDGRVVIKGDPFGMGAEAFAQAVTKLIPNKRRGGVTHFTTTPGPNADKTARLVLLFNVRASGDICRMETFEPVTSPSGEIRLDAAWCPGPSAHSFATGYLSSASGVADRGFRALVEETATELFPTENHHLPTEPDNNND
ncbi:MAG: hypothetical protein AB7P12_08285 [Alphaproteobacteria bacterium]